jgi:ribonuclease D
MECLHLAMQQPMVALDTEFVWERTYYPGLGLIQLGWSASETWLIDTVALRDLTPLRTLIESADVVKVLHDAPQDLTILLRACGGTIPRSIFDTRTASGFAGGSSTCSLRKVLEDTVGISIAKTESRSDWLRRPLTAAQMEYAKEDVQYLVQAARILEEWMTEQRTLSAFREEMQDLEEESLYAEKSPESAYLKIKGHNRLRPRDRSILLELAAWREEEARASDQPRGRVVADDALLALCQRSPKSREEVLSVRGTPPQYASALYSAFQQGLDRHRREPMEPEPYVQDEEALLARVDLVLSFLKGEALYMGIDPALVASRTEVLQVCRKESLEGSPFSAGWRHTLFGKSLLDVLTGSLSVRIDASTGLPRSHAG